MVTTAPDLSLSDPDEAVSFVIVAKVVNSHDGPNTCTPLADIAVAPGRTFDWDWGDGTVERGLTGIPGPHTYSEAGTYAIRITGPITAINATEGRRFVSLSVAPTEEPRVSVAEFAVLDNGIRSLLTVGVTGGSPDYLAENGLLSGLRPARVVLPDTVETIGDGTFAYDDQLAEIRLPSSLRTLGSLCFMSCASLESVTLPDALETIGKDCFYGCELISSITIPRLVGSIGQNPFRGCTGLAAILVATGNARFASIDDKVLVDVIALRLIRVVGTPPFTIPPFVREVDAYCFEGITGSFSASLPNAEKIGPSAFEGCSGLSSVVLGSSLASLGARAFRNCTALSSGISLSEGVKTLEASCFDGSGITSFSAECVERIGSRCLAACPSLASIRLPPSFQGLASGATQPFYGSTHVSELIIESPEAVDLGSAPFGPSFPYSQLSVRVRPELVAAFKAILPWRNYQSCVKAYYGTCTVDIAITYPQTTVYVRQPTVASGSSAAIDWGDGTPPEAFNGETSHTYPSGTYRIVVTGDVTGWDGRLDGYVHYSFVSTHNQETYYSGDDSPATAVRLGYGITTLGADFFARTNVPRIELPRVLQTIGARCFLGARITEIEIPESVTSIGEAAFDHCEDMVRATVKGAITTVPADMFFSCFSLREIDLPSSVTSFTDYPFTSCDSLQSLTIRATVPPNMRSSEVIGELPNSCRIYVPAGSVSAYKADSHWSARASSIYAIT